MKKILALVLSLALVFAMAACGGETDPPENTGEPDDTESQTTENTDNRILELTFYGVNTDPALKSEARFADLVAESSAGTVMVKSLTSAEDLSDREKLEKVISGECDIVVGSADVFAEAAGDLYLFDSFGLFESSDDVKAFLGGESLNSLRTGIEENGLEFLGIWDTGFSQIILAETSVKTAEDLEGLKIGTGLSEDLSGLWTKAGADAVHLDEDEIFQEFDELTVDAYEGSIETMMKVQAQTAGSYLVKTSHAYRPYVVLMNLDKFNSLTDIQKAAVMDSMREVQMNSFSESDAYQNYALKEFEKAETEIIELTDEEREAFVSSLRTESSEKLITKLMPHAEILDAVKEELKVLRESEVADAQ